MPRRSRSAQILCIGVALACAACNNHCADEVDCEDTMRVGHNHDGRRVFVEDCAEHQNICEVVDEDHAICMPPSPLLVCGWLEGACATEAAAGKWATLIDDGNCMALAANLDDDTRRCLYFSDCSEIDGCR